MSLSSSSRVSGIVPHSAIAHSAFCKFCRCAWYRYLLPVTDGEGVSSTTSSWMLVVCEERAYDVDECMRTHTQLRMHHDVVRSAESGTPFLIASQLHALRSFRLQCN